MIQGGQKETLGRKSLMNFDSVNEPVLNTRIFE